MAAAFLDRVTPAAARPGLYGFAATVRRPDHIDAIEIAGVTCDGEDCERTESGNADFYSVYWHIVRDDAANRGGCDCFADLPTLDEARELAYLLSKRFNLPVQEYA